MQPLPTFITAFMSVFRDHGYDVYVVGGAVRDLVLGRQVMNWDFTTNATPEQIQTLFPDNFYHNTYGTVSVKLRAGDEVEAASKIKVSNSVSVEAAQGSVTQNNFETDPMHILEVTPYRREGKYEDSRHPTEIAWAQTLAEDLARRDFTVNAMAYDGQTVTDLYSGQKDIESKLIRTVGDPGARFSEDALRLMRAVRLAAQLGFMIEEQTRLAIQAHAQDITKVSAERVRDELFKILTSDHPSEGVLFLRGSGLLKYILPELDRCFTVDQKSPERHHIYDVGTHSVMSLKYCESPDVITRFATLLHDIGKADTYAKDPDTGIITFYNHEYVSANYAKAIATRLHLSKHDSDKLIRLILYHQFVVHEDLTDNAIRRFIRNVGKENLDDMFALRHADRQGGGATETSWRTDLFKKRVAQLLIEPFTVADLKIDGHDVMTTLNLKPGPEVGKILNDLFVKVENKELPNEREALLQELTRTSVV